MKNKLKILLTLCISILCTTYVFAADFTGWHVLEGYNFIYYVKDNGEFARNEWLWLPLDDGSGMRHYYFNKDAFLECNSITPDGKTVNERGEEVVDGVPVDNYTKINDKIIPTPRDKKNIIEDINDDNIYHIYKKYSNLMTMHTVVLNKTFNNIVTTDDIGSGRSDAILDGLYNEYVTIHDEAIDKMNVVLNKYINDPNAILEYSNCKMLLDSELKAAKQNIDRLLKNIYDIVDEIIKSKR